MKAQSRTKDRFPFRPTTAKSKPRGQFPRRSLEPIVASPMPVYLSGVAMGIGCGVLVLLLLIGIP
jgi:hypothetical protein